MKMPLHLAFAAVATTITSTAGRAAQYSAKANLCAIHAPEAAARAGLSVDIVVRVMMAESGGNSRAVSRKGAMGCMQIMPATWAYLAARYELGRDPFDARMNMIAGAMYLGELAARYGFPGAYSAYNAGPGRYQRHVVGGVPLPTETVAYATRLVGSSSRTIAVVPRWQNARLFIDRPVMQANEVSKAAIGGTRELSSRAASADDVRRNPLFPLTQTTVSASAVAADGATGRQ